MPALALFLALAIDNAAATEIGDRPFGIGVVLGDPTGLSGKYYLGGRSNAVDMALAFDTRGSNDGWLYAHATYLWHPSVIAKGPDVELPWHVGIGAFVATDQSNNDGGEAFGVRVPIGLDADLEKIPLQFFGDIALHVTVLPATDVDFDIGLGARFYP
jgi:hypothetical protein